MMRAGDTRVSLLHVNRGRIRIYTLNVVRRQLSRSRKGQCVMSLKAVNKKVCRHFNLRPSGGVSSIIKGTLIYQEHEDMTIRWFDDRQTQLDIRKK